MESGEQGGGTGNVWSELRQAKQATRQDDRVEFQDGAISCCCKRYLSMGGGRNGNMATFSNTLGNSHCSG